MQENTEEFDHKKASISDKILMIGEFEHIRRHALRASASVMSDDEESQLKSYRYEMIADVAKRLRREYMKREFGDVSDTDWCLLKATASLRQLFYETSDYAGSELKEIDEFIDTVWESALGVDLSDCVACKEDKDA